MAGRSCSSTHIHRCSPCPVHHRDSRDVDGSPLALYLFLDRPYRSASGPSDCPRDRGARRCLSPPSPTLPPSAVSTTHLSSASASGHSPAYPSTLYTPLHG